MSEKLKYLIHCLAFFCMPLIIIRGIELLILKEKKVEVVEFTPVKEPKVKTIWTGNLSVNSQVILSPYSDSSQLNQFNNDVTNRFFEEEYSFCFLYVAHYGKQPLEFSPSTIKCIVNIHEQEIYENQSPITKKTSLYLEVLLNKSIIRQGTLHKFLIAFPKNTSILESESIDLKWQNKQIDMRKIVCLRNSFNEFLAKPTFDFFHQKN